MDPFWAPLGAYTLVTLGGMLIAGLGAWVDEQGNHEAAKVPMLFGSAVLFIGIGGAIIHLIGSLIEYIL